MAFDPSKYKTIRIENVEEKEKEPSNLDKFNNFTSALLNTQDKPFDSFGNFAISLLTSPHKVLEKGLGKVTGAVGEVLGTGIGTVLTPLASGIKGRERLFTPEALQEATESGEETGEFSKQLGESAPQIAGGIVSGGGAGVLPKALQGVATAINVGEVATAGFQAGQQGKQAVESFKEGDTAEGVGNVIGGTVSLLSGIFGMFGLRNDLKRIGIVKNNKNLINTRKNAVESFITSTGLKGKDVDISNFTKRADDTLSTFSIQDITDGTGKNVIKNLDDFGKKTVEKSIQLDKIVKDITKRASNDGVKINYSDLRNEIEKELDKFVSIQRNPKLKQNILNNLGLENIDTPENVLRDIQEKQANLKTFFAKENIDKGTILKSNPEKSAEIFLEKALNEKLKDTMEEYIGRFNVQGLSFRELRDSQSNIIALQDDLKKQIIKNYRNRIIDKKERLTFQNTFEKDLLRGSLNQPLRFIPDTLKTLDFKLNKQTLLDKRIEKSMNEYLKNLNLESKNIKNEVLKPVIKENLAIEQEAKSGTIITPQKKAETTFEPKAKIIDIETQDIKNLTKKANDNMKRVNELADLDIDEDILISSQKVDELSQKLEALKTSITEHKAFPARKFISKQGEFQGRLRELGSETKFGKEGDKIATELGFETAEDLRNAIEDLSEKSSEFFSLTRDLKSANLDLDDLLKSKGKK